MESIGDILKNIIDGKHLNQDQTQIRETALQNQDVQKFLSENKIDQATLERSMDNLVFYVQQLNSASNQRVMAGYRPKLFLNGNVIDITYAPTEQKQKEDENSAAAKRIELIDLPEKLRHVELEEVDQNPDRMKAISEIARFLIEFDNNKHARGLYLEGDFGVGKTYLLAALANSVARKGVKVIFLHVPSFIASLSSHFGDNSLNDEIERIANAPVVIFDDIGAETLSEWSRDDVLGVILQKRMDNELPTFFSSNLNLTMLNEHFAQVKNSNNSLKAERLMERINFVSKEVRVLGKNRRYR
ncbi:primosomal protein DnaI [Lactobacillus sp.]|uniref:primosomal protein DnaI n=1 Tax=Lactobacillus sp. TaxID=1591 RepID=UPI0019A42188|nr:primosomal protein DnaI [Lactobacillus sp.]MBD5429038.1 primosomal protein DnaI [Lactobacillus sp.]MBD5430260.1 primosomal protein DnaI [Lactobacillus sp.]